MSSWLRSDSLICSWLLSRLWIWQVKSNHDEVNEIYIPKIKYINIHIYIYSNIEYHNRNNSMSITTIEHINVNHNNRTHVITALLVVKYWIFLIALFYQSYSRAINGPIDNSSPRVCERNIFPHGRRLSRPRFVIYFYRIILFYFCFFFFSLYLLSYFYLFFNFSTLLNSIPPHHWSTTWKPQSLTAMI